MKRQTDPDVLLLQAAADPTRLEILRRLSERVEVCACDFTAFCDVSQPTVSHHLKVLSEAGSVDGERRGTWVFYALRPDAVARFRELADGFGPGARGLDAASTVAAGGLPPGRPVGARTRTTVRTRPLAGSRDVADPASTTDTGIDRQGPPMRPPWDAVRGLPARHDSTVLGRSDG